MNKFLIVLSFIVLIYLSFHIGQLVQFKKDEAKVNQIFEWSTTCDLPLNDGKNTVVEVDCLTPESYRVMDNYFFNSLVSDKHLLKWGLNNYNNLLIN